MKPEQVGGPAVKGYAADSVKAEGDGYVWTISTGAVDRDHDTLAVDGWDLSDYQKNPVVLWMHDAKLGPIGHAESVLVRGGALKARVVFQEKGRNPLADHVRALVEDGLIKAASVGFQPIEWTFNEKRGGIDFKRQSLLEFSLVSVPSNGQALMDAKASGRDLTQLVPSAESLMEGVYGPGQWIRREVAAGAMEAIQKLEDLRSKTKGLPSLIAAAIREAVTKAGRTISAANEQRLSSALSSIEDSASSIGAAAELIEEVLDLAAPPADEPEKAVEPFILLMPSEPVPTYLVDPNHVVAAARAAVSATVRAAVNTARGRLD